MISHLPPLIATVTPVLAWCAVLVLLIASLCCILFTMRAPRRPLVYVAAVLLGLALIVVALPAPDAPPLFRVLIGLLALALSVTGGGPASQLVLALASRGAVPGVHGGIVIAEAATPEQRADGVQPTHEVLRGGTTIGFLERFATTGAIMAGFPEALAVLDRDQRRRPLHRTRSTEARERFIIGTLTSLIWACVCAGVFRPRPVA